MRPPGERLLEHLAATAELCGSRLSDIAARILVADLAAYDEDAVIEALKRTRNEHEGPLTLPAITKRITTVGGHPGPEEAWALCPKDEEATVVTTKEIISAWNLCKAVYYSGDQIGARMAFKEAYAQSIAGQRHSQAHWFVSFGNDRAGRVHPILEAVRAGRLSAVHALTLVDEDQQNEMRQVLCLPVPVPNPQVAAMVRAAIAKESNS